MRLAGLSFRFECGISACTGDSRVRHNGHNVTGYVSSCASLLEMGLCRYWHRVGPFLNHRHLISCRKPAQFHRGWVCSGLGLHWSIAGDDYVAMGPKSDVCCVLGEIEHDDGRTSKLTSQLQNLYGAKCGRHVGHASAAANRQCPCDHADALGTTWHSAAKLNSR